MQLLEPERQFSGGRAAALGERIRDGLLRDNKVVPAVLAILVLLVFAWLVGSALLGGPGDEQEHQQASNQASLTPEEEGSEGEDSGPPAPRVENRDTESFAAFKPKDPFRQIIPRAKAGETTNESTTSRSGSSNSKAGGATKESTTGKSGASSRGGGGGGFIEQTSPSNADGRAGGGGRGAGEGGDPSGGGGRGAGESGDTSGGGPGEGGGAGRGGNGGLFNSGGDLPVP